MVEVRKHQESKVNSLQAEEWHEFSLLLENIFSEEDRGTIAHAYYVAERAHGHQKRRSGERYFSHPRESAIILIEAGITTARPIILALLHDVEEDTDFLEEAPGFVPEGYTRSYYRIMGSFDESVAFGLDMLTEPESLYLGKKAADKEYRERFNDEGLWLWAAELHDDSLMYDVLLVKMADRLHNLRTLGAMPEEKQIAKINETTKFYMPAFKRIKERYPLQGNTLLTQLNSALRVLQQPQAVGDFEF